VEVLGDVGWRGHRVQVGQLGARVQPGFTHLFGEAAPGLILARDAPGALDGRDLLDERAAAVFDADQALGTQQRDGPVDRGLVQVVLPGQVGLAGQRRARRVVPALDRIAERVGLYRSKISRWCLTCGFMSGSRGPVVLVDHAAE
jgi:hypothetical protein